MPNDHIATKQDKIIVEDVNVTTNTNGLFYPTLPAGAIMLNVLNNDSNVYAIVPYGNASYIAFYAASGQWQRLASTTFSVKLVYFIVSN